MAANIKAMMETLKAMEEMQSNVNKDINKDINKKRKEALAKIREYLDDVADSLGGMSLTIPLPNGTVFSDFEHGQCINFNSGYRLKTSDAARWSEEKIKWNIDCYSSHRESDSCYYYYIDGTNDISEERNPEKWAPGFIRLIEKWGSIKAIIEAGIEEKLTKKMEQIRKDTAERIRSYESVNEFEV